MEKQFRSKIGVLLITILFIPPVFPILCGGPFIVAIIFVPFISLAIALFMSFKYTVTATHLEESVYGIKIPLHDIVSIKRSYNILGGPAYAFKRLKIKLKKSYTSGTYVYPYSGAFLLISPVREQEFLDTLKQLNPEIEIDVSNKTGWWRIWDWNI